MSFSQSSSSIPPGNPTHPSRRENQSISSTHSRGSERGRGSRSTGSPPVESAVTRLLVSIKLLLEALTKWSELQMNESQVSDVYVRLGNDFNAAVAAFRSFNIDMSELLTVPDNLRTVLEDCLSEDATPKNLDKYLPDVRQIITSLLQGLRSKQSAYRRIVSDAKHRTGDSQIMDRESRSGRMSRTESASSSGGTLSRSQYTRSVATAEGPNRMSVSDGQQKRAVSSRRKDLSVQAQPSNDDNYFVGGFVRAKTPSNEEQWGQSRHDEQSTTSITQDVPGQSTTPSPSSYGDDSGDHTIIASPPLQAPVPPNVVRYSLSDKPVPFISVDEATPPQSSESISAIGLDRTMSTVSTTSDAQVESPTIDAAQAPVIANSLAALKKSETLERRASKRFSTYNISKMTGGSLRERSGLGRSVNRRSLAVDSSNLTPNELNVLAEEDEVAAGAKPGTRESSRSRESSSSRKSRATTPIAEEDVPPIPPLPEASSSNSDPKSAVRSKDAPEVPDKPREVIVIKQVEQVFIPPTTSPQKASPQKPLPKTLTVYLQLGRDVKKVKIDRGISYASLRVLFVDRFSYNPGLDNFPGIYIRDPSSGVMYELENMEEIKDGCLLSLNIDPLDQVKQHIDLQLSSLAQELKELRSSVGSSKRASHLSRQQPIVAQPFLEAESPVSRPTDKQFQRVARRLSHLVMNDSVNVQVNNVSQTVGTLQPQMTGASIVSEASTRIVADLKTQFDEVQNLRRDLGVMRQIYVDFMAQTKESIASLTAQAQTVRQLSSSKVGGARAYVDAGKSSLDTRTQTVLTRVEELQDTVENLKDDVLKRFVSPRSNVVKTVAKDISEVAAELESLQEYVSTVKPMWKKTWEEELQNIVEEQQFLSHQEEFLGDLLEDHKALSEVFGHVEKVISIRGTGQVKTKSFRPPPPEEGQNGLNTLMMEIRGAAGDPERRMKAIAANQKNREREKANRTDEFEDELKGFVSGKKLKMTGGAEEAERVRQKKSEQTLKAMFTGNSTMSAQSSPDTTVTEGLDTTAI